jgi:hypothetical protein
MLARLADLPHSIFSEAELRALNEADFEAARYTRLLRYNRTDLHYAMYPCSSPACEGASRTIAEVRGQYFALCNCPVSESLIPVQPAEIKMWRVDLDCLSALLQQSNGLSGEAEALNDRLIYLGKRTRSSVWFGVILALVTEEHVRLYVDSLPRQFAQSHDRLVIVCPGFRPRQTLARAYEGRPYIFASLSEHDPLVIEQGAFGLPSDAVGLRS